MKTLICIASLTLSVLPLAAESLRSATVTAAIQDVQIYSGNNSAHKASIGEKLTLPSSLQTGRKSRAELTFTDNTLTRLGQNSVFSFREGGRNVELKQGSVLMQVPKTAGGATIRTATVTCAITGTTSMFEYNPKNWIKLITLEGTQKLTINGSKISVLLPAGKMIIMHPDAKVIPAPVDIDIAKLIKTSQLIQNGGFAPLPATALALINDTVHKQTVAKRQGLLQPTNQLVTGPGARTSNEQASSILGGGTSPITIFPVDAQGTPITVIVP
jgi:hypothetical protein